MIRIEFCHLLPILIVKISYWFVHHKKNTVETQKKKERKKGLMQISEQTYHLPQQRLSKDTAATRESFCFWSFLGACFTLSFLLFILVPCLYFPMNIVTIEEHWYHLSLVQQSACFQNSNKRINVQLRNLVKKTQC